MGSELLVVNRGARTRMAVTSAPKNREITKSSDFDQSETVRVGVLGASGYTGSEVRIRRTFLRIVTFESAITNQLAKILTYGSNSGFIGKIIRLLATHPVFKVTVMTADRKAGQSLASVFPQLITQV